MDLIRKGKFYLSLIKSINGKGGKGRRAGEVNKKRAQGKKREGRRQR